MSARKSAAEPQITTTGHTVGVTYASHYWDDTYTVLGTGPNGTGVHVRRADGREAVHSTSMAPDPEWMGTNDHSVDEPCVRRRACRKRTEQREK